MNEASNLHGASGSGRGRRYIKAKKKLPREYPCQTVAGTENALTAPKLLPPESNPETNAQYSAAGDPPLQDYCHIDLEKKYSRAQTLSGFLSPWLDPALLMLVVAALYAQTLHHSFHFDDKSAIWENQVILTGLTWANLKDIFSHNRPIAIFSFALNYYFGGLETLSYHLVNITIHAVNAILLYFFIKFTLRVSSTVTEETRRPIAFFTALLWAVHPLQVQSVTFIYQRMNSLATMFFLGAMLCYVGARRPPKPQSRWLLTTMCVCFGMLAVSTKENTAILPAAFLFYELYFFRDFDLGWLRCKAVMIIGGFFAALVCLVPFLYLGKTMVWELLRGGWGYSNWNFTMGQRLLTEARVVIYYLSLFLFPDPERLNLDHDFTISTSLLSPPTTLFSLLALLAIAGWAVAWARRERLFSFCILWFFLCLAIESSFIGLEIIYEHRMYLPSMLTCLLLVLALYRFVRLRHLRLMIFCSLVLVCGYWTIVRNEAWATEISLWSDSVKKAPGKARPHVSLGFAYMNAARFAEAVQNFQEAVSLEPSNSDYLNNLAFALLRAGKPEESIVAAKKALQIDQFNSMAYFNLGCGYERIWKLEDALQSYSEALRLSLYPGVRNERRVDPAKAKKGVESMKQMIDAMGKRRATP